MMFASYLGTIESIARLGANATIGNIQKMNLTLTRGQVERVLKQLEREGYVTHALEAYGRTGKKVYYLSDLCVTNIVVTAGAAETSATCPEMAVAS